MSRQYRDWRDYLAKCLDDFMPVNQRYTLLHTANLVGLFTCVFVKSSEMSRIREVDAAEVKLGMKGRYGNKVGPIYITILQQQLTCAGRAHCPLSPR